MKRILLMILVALPIVGLAQSSTFTLKARIAGISGSGRVYLTYQIPGKMMVDSALINDGSFKFNGTVPYPLKAQLWMDHRGGGITKLGPNPDMLTLFLDKEEISINATDSIKNSIITGSRINAEYIEYKAFIAVPVKEMALITAEKAAVPADQTNDQQIMDDLKLRYQKAAENKIALQYQYIKLNPNSEFSLGALHEVAGPYIDVATIEPIYNGLSADIRNSMSGQQFAKSIEIARNTAVGSMAPVFIQNDVDDKPVNLIDFRGKYVLLDFWASWCAPCRAENPNVVKTYQQFKDKNFTVLGVSLDRPGKKDSWIAAIKADGLTWTQVSDLKFWDNTVVKLYGITGIPQNYLIDPAGKIIGKNLKGEELERKLTEVLSQ
ncbi:TlpA disulfide reductase family protein [Mucilaginibacter sp.]|uniref:TlpA disulfide reductase family protein n=1 Tax=Mucilaginibacter sp. TaxID=1882438 RepID=UPI0026290D08|nr:TlpA disulfide reductase family protein [Mucilaginibacter sp.]MDB4925993.1 thioredoxin [Mucilaginibacter sp.]